MSDATVTTSHLSHVIFARLENHLRIHPDFDAVLEFNFRHERSPRVGWKPATQWGQTKPSKLEARFLIVQTGRVSRPYPPFRLDRAPPTSLKSRQDVKPSANVVTSCRPEVGRLVQT